MITSLHSPHVERVKALLGSRGVKERKKTGSYVIEGLTNLREVIECESASIETIYVAESADGKFQELPPSPAEVVLVSDQVMRAMSDTVTPQGILAIAKVQERELKSWLGSRKSTVRLAYFWQIQDPGNAGTVIRAADAFGFDAVIFSDQSVDIYSPKVVRSTAGSLWHLPVFEDVVIEDLLQNVSDNSIRIFATTASGTLRLEETAQEFAAESSLWIFGNEARGLRAEILGDSRVQEVSIPMKGRAESLNLASAATVVMFVAGANRK